MSDTGFNLRKWVTNNAVLLSIIDKNENGEKVISTDELEVRISAELPSQGGRDREAVRGSHLYYFLEF